MTTNSVILNIELVHGDVGDGSTFFGDRLADLTTRQLRAIIVWQETRKREAQKAESEASVRRIQRAAEEARARIASRL